MLAHVGTEIGKASLLSYKIYNAVNKEIMWLPLMSVEVSVPNQASGSPLYLCPFKFDKDCSSIMHLGGVGGWKRGTPLPPSPEEKFTIWDGLSSLCCQVSFLHIVKENFKSSISQPVRVLW